MKLIFVLDVRSENQGEWMKIIIETSVEIIQVSFLPLV